jgi:hypothetical protein
MALLHQIMRPEELAQLTPGEIDALATQLDSELVNLLQRENVQNLLGSRMRRSATNLRRARRQRQQGESTAGNDELILDDDDEI